MRRETIILAGIVVVVIIGAIVGSNYYRSSIQSGRVTSNSNSGKPAISAEQLDRPGSNSLGPADAKVTVVEFYDPECEACAAFAPVVKKLFSEYGGKFRLVMRYMPLHPNSVAAANFTEVAAEQGKYGQAMEMLFQKQPEWGTKHGGAPDPSTPSITDLFDRYATELGLDPAKVRSAIKENRFGSKIEQDKKDGQSLGVRQTPTFFVNGRQLARLGEADLRALIDEELKRVGL
ncbi:MAG: thioredoxin domain-containing protein [Pyrinomonadaceae bacterium]